MEMRKRSGSTTTGTFYRSIRIDLYRIFHHIRYRSPAQQHADQKSLRAVAVGQDAAP